jgi:hypothetical protein
MYELGKLTSRIVVQISHIVMHTLSIDTGSQCTDRVVVDGQHCSVREL